MNQLTNFWTFSFWIFCNKLLSFLRTGLQMNMVGDSFVSDGFFAANRVLSLVKRIFVDGSFEAAFISYKKEEGEGFLCGVFLVLLVFFFLIGLIIMSFSMPIAKLMKLNKPQTISFSKSIYIMGFIPCLLSIFSLLTANENCKKNFFAIAISPFLGNLSYTLFLILCNKYTYAISIGSLIYALSQVIFIMFFSFKDLLFWPTFSINFIKRMFLHSFNGLAVPISDLISNKIASMTPGGLSHMEYAHKIIYFVFSVIGIPLSYICNSMLLEKKENSTNIFVSSSILAIFPAVSLFINGEMLCSSIFMTIKNIKQGVQLSKVISILGVSIYFLIMNRVLLTILSSKKKFKESYISTIIYSVIHACGSILVKNKGVIGLVWVNNLANLINFTSLFYFARKEKLVEINTKQSIHIIFSIIISYFLQIPMKLMRQFFLKYFSITFGFFIFFGIIIFNNILSSKKNIFINLLALLLFVLYIIYLPISFTVNTQLAASFLFSGIVLQLIIMVFFIEYFY